MSGLQSKFCHYVLDDDSGKRFIGLSYIYERPMLIGRLNLKMFKFGKCVHFHLICIKCMHFPENVHILCKLVENAHIFSENACILCKLDENAHIFRGKMCAFSMKICAFYAN